MKINSVLGDYWPNEYDEVIAGLKTFYDLFKNTI